MALSVFSDKSKPPKPKDLKEILGRANAHWTAIVDHVAKAYPPLDQTWGFSGASWGWALRLRQKKRTVMYLTPCEKHFLVGFALGDKAVRAAHDLRCRQAILELIDSAKKYAEGRAIRIEVRNKRDRDDVIKLAAVKMEN
jgi:hypothetical protein